LAIVSARWKSWITRSPVLIALVAGLVVLAGPDDRWLAASAWLGTLGLCEALFRSPSRPVAILSGLVFGSAANVVGLNTLGPLLSAYAHVPLWLAWSAALLTWLVQGIPYAVAAWLAEAIVRRGWPRWLAISGSLTSALALCPQIFPWHLGATQVGFLPFAQVAELGGESLLGLCFFASVAAAHGTFRARGAKRIATLSIALAALSAPVLYGLVRLPAIERERALAPKLELGVVQADAQLPDGADIEAYARASLATLKRLTIPLEAHGVALTLWGESAYPYPLLRTTQNAPTDVRAPLGDGVRGPLLMGLETYSSLLDNGAKFNSAWLVRRDGRLGARVDKARLIPFAEYVPFWQFIPQLQAFFHSPGFSPGAPGTVRLGESRLGVLICYEDLFASAAREPVRSGARALIDLTNDVWFGKSRVTFLHDLFARLRAIEQRRDLVRAVNTGRSSFTAATGEQLAHGRAFTETSFAVEVALLDARTPYSLLGDLTAPACALLVMLALARRRLKPGSGA
jgi:apolipoprotein N-acyltransferase